MNDPIFTQARIITRSRVFGLLAIVALATLAFTANATSCGIGGTTHWVNGRCEPIAQPANIQAGAGATSTATSGPQNQTQTAGASSTSNPVTTVSPTQSSADKALYLNIANGGAVVGLVPPAPGMCQRSHSEAKVRKVNLLIIGFDFQDAVSDSFTDLDCVDKYFDQQRAMLPPAPTLSLNEPIHPPVVVVAEPAPEKGVVRKNKAKNKAKGKRKAQRPAHQCPAGEVPVCTAKS